MLSRINPFHAALLSLVLLLLAVIFVLAVFSEIGTLFTEGQREFDSYRLANFLRQTSEDLTSMARLHVVTGEQRYRDYFDEILDIRGGVAPYPENYVSRPYWDIVLATGERPGGFAETSTLEEMAESIGISDEAAELLLEAERQSNDLVRLERETMDMVAAHLEAGGDYSVVEGNLLAAVQRLHGQEYHAAKEGIMQPLVGFADLADRGVRDFADAAVARLTRLSIALGISLLLGILSALLLVLLLRRGASGT
ncbi:MAG: hypothetical protein OXF44_01250 [Anaerolineaceae bacterium]|nr:hypothetical protein [Anaerolineaceae bacterium]